MNFYKHHIGDYATATAHLSWDEDMAYRRLLQVYYQHEKPIPLDKRAIYRLVRAQTKAQREAVDVVLAEFFDPQDDGWHNERADEEIAEANEFAEEREARKANEAERQRRHRARRKELFAVLREHGQVPKYDTTTEVLEAMLSRVTSGSGHGDNRVTGVTGNAPATANQKPVTRKDQKQEHSSRADTSLPAATAEPSPTDAGRACRQMRTAGCAQTNPAHPDLLAALAEGVTPDALAATAAEAVEAGKAKPFAWAIATARSRHAEGAKPIATGPPRQTQAPAKSRTLQALEVLERMKTHDPVDETGNPDRPAETRHALAGPYSRA